MRLFRYIRAPFFILSVASLLYIFGIVLHVFWGVPWVVFGKAEYFNETIFHKKQTFTGIVRDIEKRTKGDAIIVHSVRSEQNNSLLAPMVLFEKNFRHDNHQLIVGDIVRFQCSPLPPRFDGGKTTCFLYDNADKIKNGAPGVRRSLFLIRESFRAQVERVFSEPDASLIIGLLIGDRSGIPKEYTEAFQKTGTSHILAISGYNITKLVSITIVFLAFFSFDRRKTSRVTAIIIIGFVCIVGADASVVRAGIMGLIALLARMTGRRYAGISALLFAAAIMLFFDPFALRNDIGFRLSFAAVLGLALFTAPLEKIYSRAIPLSTVASLLAETTSATIATLPLVLYDFGSVASSTLIANTIILPIIPVIMVLGALGTMIGLWSPFFSLPITFVVSICIRFVEAVVFFFANHTPMFFVQITFWESLMLFAWLVFLGVIFKIRTMDRVMV